MRVVAEALVRVRGSVWAEACQEAAVEAERVVPEAVLAPADQAVAAMEAQAAREGVAVPLTLAVCGVPRGSKAAVPVASALVGEALAVGPVQVDRVAVRVAEAPEVGSAWLAEALLEALPQRPV